MNFFESISLKQLQALQPKVERLLEESKDDLIHVLRFWMFEYIVPKQIEGISKYLVLHQRSLQPSTRYTLDHRSTEGIENIDFEINKIVEDTYSITRSFPDQKKENLTLTIFFKDDTRYIIHDGVTYRQTPETGNTYAHLRSQQKDIEQGTTIDLEAGVISEKEKLIAEIINTFHDIPEKGALEICKNTTENFSKNDKDRNEEHAKAHQIIDEVSFMTKEDKILLKGIIDNYEGKDSYFKWFEYLRYFIHDNKLMYDNKKFQYNHEKIVGDLSVCRIYKILEEYTLPSGKRIRAIDLPSTKATLREHKDRIDFILGYTKDHCFHHMNEKGHAFYETAVQEREAIKNML